MRNRFRGSTRKCRGFSFIEVLIASMIVGLSLVAMISTWYVSIKMTGETSDQGIAYNLARQTIETIKGTGFSNTPEAPTTAPIIHYYDGSETLQDSNPSAGRYIVTTTVVSSVTVPGSNPVTPDNFALRTVTVTVTLATDGTVLCQFTTYLVRGGT